MRLRIWLARSLSAILLLTAVALPVQPTAGADGIGLVVDGKEIVLDQPPRIEAGRTLVPIRFVAEALGATVRYDPDGPGVEIVHPVRGRFYLYIGRAEVILPDGRSMPLDVAAQIIEGRTFVPVRFVAEAFGAKVQWDEASRTVRITTGAAPGTPGTPGAPGVPGGQSAGASPPAWPDASCVTPEASTYFRAVHNAGPWGSNPMHFKEQPQGYFDYLKALNVNWVGISPVWYLNSKSDDTLFPAPPGGLNNGQLQTWPDDELRIFIRRLRCQGFHVFLGLAARDVSVDGQYHRYEYWPTDRFQQSYTEFVLHYAQLAQDEGVELLSIGTEMDTAIHPHWAGWLQGLLAQVRAVYKGSLSYDQHYSAFLSGPRPAAAGDPHYWWELPEDPKSLWELDFDYIGLSVYDLNLAAGGDNSEAAQTARWQEFFAQVKAAHERYGKPVLLLEVGQDNIDPADIGKPKAEAYARQSTAAGQQLQVNALKSLFKASDGYDWYRGGFLWEYWVMDDAECQAATCRGIGFTTRGKPADAVVQKYYGQRREGEGGTAVTGGLTPAAGAAGPGPGVTPPPGGKPPPGGTPPPAGTCPIPDPNGPCFHQIYAAGSSDGQKWTADNKLLFDQAAGPGALYRDGTIYLYFVDPVDGGPVGLSVAVSSDGGATFQKQPVQVTADHRGLADPNPVLLGDGQIRLYYFRGDAMGSGPDTLHQFYSAVSDDGVHFTPEPGVRFSYAGITDPDVFAVGDHWVMLASQGRRQIRATSDDGLTFTYQNTLDMGGSVSSTFPIGGTLQTFYCADNGIAMAATADGVTWGQGQTVLTAASGQFLCDPTVVQLKDGSYRLFYKVFKGDPAGMKPPPVPGQPPKPRTAP